MNSYVKFFSIIFLVSVFLVPVFIKPAPLAALENQGTWYLTITTGSSSQIRSGQFNSLEDCQSALASSKLKGGGQCVELWSYTVGTSKSAYFDSLNDCLANPGSSSATNPCQKQNIWEFLFTPTSGQNINSGPYSSEQECDDAITSASRQGISGEAKCYQGASALLNNKASVQDDSSRTCVAAYDENVTGFCNSGGSPCPAGTDSVITTDCAGSCCVSISTDSGSTGATDTRVGSVAANSDTNSFGGSGSSSNGGNRQGGGGILGGIIPCGGSGSGEPNAPGSRQCTFKDLVTLGNNVINFLIFKAAVPLATLLFMWAGFLYMFKATSGGQEEAKKIFWNVFWGFIIALAAFLIIKLILNGLEVKPEVWQKYLSG